MIDFWTSLIIAFLFGSFTNVLIYRIPRQESLIKPRSHCPECKHQLKWYENIPILSYIFLRARCSQCHTKISLRYPLVELLLGILGVMFYCKVQHFAEYLFTLIVLSSVVAMAFIDHKYRRLPHALSYSTIIIAFIYISVYGSPYYLPLEAFAPLPNTLGKLFTALSFFGVTIVSLDCFTHVMNLIYFRSRALRITPQALCFNNQFLIKHVTWLYLVITVSEAALIYFHQVSIFFYLNLIIGCSYFINEICLEYLFNPNLSEKLPDARHASSEEEQGQSVFGGGDTILVTLTAVLLGPLPALMVLLASFYLALIYFVGVKIFSVGKNGIDEKYIPLGGALSIAIIAAMMVLG